MALCYAQQLFPKTYFCLPGKVTMKLQIIKKKKRAKRSTEINGVGKKKNSNPQHISYI